MFTPLATLSLGLPSATPLTTPAVPNLGDDDATAGPIGVVNVNLAAGEIMVAHDQPTFDAPDWIGFAACCGQQDVEFTVVNAGTYRFRLYWPTGGDIDILLVDGGITTNLGQALTGNNPETITATLAAGTYILTAGLYTNNASITILKYEILRN
jgi:hypothetical protein